MKLKEMLTSFTWDDLNTQKKFSKDSEKKKIQILVDFLSHFHDGTLILSVSESYKVKKKNIWFVFA